MIDFRVLIRLAADEGIERIAVGVVVRDASGQVLMIRRAPHDVLPGLWEYPGGSLEDGEPVPAGAARELAEETGLTGVLDYVRHLDFTDQNGRQVRQFVFTTEVPDGTPLALSPDHDAPQWADPGRLPPTSDGQRSVIEWLTGRLAIPGWRPVGGYLTTIARPSVYGSFLVTDPQGRVLGMRSAINPDVWNFPGGNVEHGETPFTTALREAEEEIGLDLAAENPEVIARRRLVAVLHQQAGTEHYPVPVCSYVFDGGTLTPDQQARIRLDPAEHTEWRFETAHNWRAHMDPDRYRRLLQILRAHRCGHPLYLERPQPADDFEGILVLVTDPAGRLLMHHRDDKPGIAWPGHWTPIGGWRESDETPEETAAREVREEAGIEITRVRPVPGPQHDQVSPFTRVLRAHWDGPDSDLRLGDEGQAVRMVPLDEVLALKVPPYLHHYLPLLGHRPSASGGPA
ncbi:NUDIX hydrolase [Streptomyces sp. NRRL WC-3742]|uniref:NUDIX hydrolase n=1 Tax=Streptomyces sp. NRRL WC-3742 TaxID=1463934 RepID=UPI00068963AF|nr:NUDIX hydrolase [Streptomyces sp. NRRL WC-3742]